MRRGAPHLRSSSPATKPHAVRHDQAVASHLEVDTACTGSGHNGRSALRSRSVACCGTTASRPSNVLAPNSPDLGTSHSVQHGVQAEPAANLRGCQTPFYRSVVLERSWAKAHMINR